MSRPTNADATMFKSGVQAVEAGRKGGKKSAQRRKERKAFKDAILTVLSEPLTNKDGTPHPSGMNVQEAMIRGVIARAIKGDPRALEVIRDTVGEKPAQDVNVRSGNYKALDSAFQALGGDEP